jgi:Uma2 family endonuclease
MILEVLTRPQVSSPLRGALEATENGHAEGEGGEDRLVMSGVSWERCQQVDSALGQDRPDPRLYFLEGELEIMSTSTLHEKIKKWLGMLIEEYFYESGFEIFPHGQATLQLLGQAGAEPDESCCLGQEKEHPDLVLEIILTSGGINKLEIYRRFAIPEVWFWRRSGLEVWSLRRDGSAYNGPAKKSRLLPDLDLATLNRCLAMDSWRAARSAFRESLAKQKPQ